MNQKPHVPEAEELSRVAEIVLGRALEGRDLLATADTAQADQTSRNFFPMSRAVLKLTDRAVDIAQDAYRGAVVQMQRLTRRETAGAEALDAIKEKTLAGEAEAPEEKLAAVAAADQEVAPQPAAEEKAMDGAPCEVAQARATAQEAANRQRKRRAERLKGSQTRIGKPKRAERAEGNLARERARTQELEQQLAQERARSRELEQQLMARRDQQKVLVLERARTQEFEQQLSIRENGQKLRAPEEPGNLEAARLMEQARLLLDQGNIIAARRVLERAAESGNARALFLLAETYDPASLSAWGIFSTWGILGRRGNATKAQELYAKAVARGVHEAKYRLNALR